MTRMADWQIEMQESMRNEVWTRTGPNRVVKVLPPDKRGITRLGGYICIGRFIAGKTPEQIEHALGLPMHYLMHGAKIYKFRRLPQISEYTYELTAKYPDGLAYTGPGGSPDYPPGSPYIHQWKIKPNATIPVEPKCLFLSPGMALPYTWL